MYKIKTINTVSQIDMGELAQVEIYNWGCEYRPKTTATLCYVKDMGFALKMVCEEKNPLAKVIPLFGGVCKDSCMEFFANFKPNVENSPYINFEANSIGAMCCEIGEQGEGRKSFMLSDIEIPPIQTFIAEDKWGLILFISNDIIKSVYGNCEFKSGDIIKGSFYKCGDDTDKPHYASFVKIDFPHPSFHRPEFFAEMQIID